jgi:flagellum-specific peptidoglycan hydrolase FlgJ
MLTYEGDASFREMANAAVRAERLTRFPAGVLLAMWACESDWGQKVTGDFNYWGITRDPSQGPAKFCATHEDITPQQLLGFRPDERATAVQGAALGAGRYRYAMSRWFASYASLDESIAAFTAFITESPDHYRPAWQAYQQDGDAAELLRALCQAGYATGPAAPTELAILQQGNIAHALEMAQQI